eukprot:TRINITY_DN13941_c0_g1_i1.p1 TRINITY_DN13941_c0_g1~~TRINITY_DN13941_c0_g1_i1.p1  ORF type:complete len:591 (-),score=91.35 TRINITY_DN13941_c0_g1_i1:352-1953(-)
MTHDGRFIGGSGGVVGSSLPRSPSAAKAAAAAWKAAAAVTPPASPERVASDQKHPVLVALEAEAAAAAGANELPVGRKRLPSAARSPGLAAFAGGHGISGSYGGSAVSGAPNDVTSGSGIAGEGGIQGIGIPSTRGGGGHGISGSYGGSVVGSAPNDVNSGSGIAGEGGIQGIGIPGTGGGGVLMRRPGTSGRSENGRAAAKPSFRASGASAPGFRPSQPLAAPSGVHVGGPSGGGSAAEPSAVTSGGVHVSTGNGLGGGGGACSSGDVSSTVAAVPVTTDVVEPSPSAISVAGGDTDDTLAARTAGVSIETQGVQASSASVAASSVGDAAPNNASVGAAVASVAVSASTRSPNVGADGVPQLRPKCPQQGAREGDNGGVGARAGVSDQHRKVDSVDRGQDPSTSQPPPKKLNIDIEKLVREHLEGDYTDRASTKQTMKKMSEYHKTWAGQFESTARSSAWALYEGIRNGPSVLLGRVQEVKVGNCACKKTKVPFVTIVEPGQEDEQDDALDPRAPLKFPTTQPLPAASAKPS